MASAPGLRRSSMTQREIRRHIGQLALVGFDGPSLAADVTALARAFDLGGVILFKRNVQAPDQVADLSAEVGRLAAGLPLWVGVDQEGGRVARLRRPFTEWPPMGVLGRAGDEGLAERFGRALGAELAAVGVTWDFAPVMDVGTNQDNPAIGDRAFGDRAGLVARLGRAVIRGLQAEGVAACAKHFPGHGDTSVDSHHALPVVEHASERLREVELEPFRAAVDEGVASIMVGHLLVPALDEERPATLSRRTIDWLRAELAFDGLVVTDDLSMRAISDTHGLADAAVGAVAAGCDVVLLCGTDADGQARAFEALIRAVEDGTLARSRVEDAMRRQREAKARFLAPGRGARPARQLRDVVGCEAHQMIAAEIGRSM